MPVNYPPIYQTISGNTAGVPVLVNTGTLTWAGGPNITLSQAGNAISISAGAIPAAGAGTGFTSAGTAGVDIKGTLGAGGLSLGVPAYLTTAQPVGAYLTTARASNDAIGLNSALTANGVSVTANSAGLSLNFPAFLTTAAASNHSHGNPTLALTNLTGTTASASNGFTLSLSAADAAAGAALSLSDALTSGTAGRLAFTNLNGVTLALSTGTGGSHTIVGSHNALTTAALSNHSHGNPTLALTNLSGTTASASDGFTLSLAAAAPGGAGNPSSYFAHPDEIANSSVHGAWVQSTSLMQPFWLPYDISFSYIRLPISLSCIGSLANVGTANNVTRGMTVSSTFNVQIFTQDTGGSSLSLRQYLSTSGSWVQRATVQAGAVGSNWSSGHTISYPQNGGMTDFTSSGAATSASFTMQSSQLSNFISHRNLEIPFAGSLSAGAYWMMYGSSTSMSTSGTANMSTLRIVASNVAVTQVNAQFDEMGVATNTTNKFRAGLGSWTTNAIATTASVALTQISRSASNPFMPFELIRRA